MRRKSIPLLTLGVAVLLGLVLVRNPPTVRGQAQPGYGSAATAQTIKFSAVPQEIVEKRLAA